MRNNIILCKFFAAVVVIILLLYFMIITPSPKIIFVPFIICGIAAAGQNVALLVNSERTATAFHNLFVIGFSLFWFGFLIAAAYFCIRQKSYSLIAFSIPFWIVGIRVVKSKLMK